VTQTRDVTVWTRARTAWFAAHPAIAPFA
jgi:hypothetical protein